MSNPDAPQPTRRALLAGGAGLLASGATAAELPPLQGERRQFVEFEPRPAMRALPLRDLLGGPATLAPPGDAALLLYVWATWCPSCATEIPRLARDQAGIARLGTCLATVSIDTRPPAAVKDYLRRQGAATLRVFQDPEAAALSAERPDGTPSPFQRWSMPLTFAVDRHGLVRGYIAGGVDWLGGGGAAFLQALAAGTS